MVSLRERERISPPLNQNITKDGRLLEFIFEQLQLKLTFDEITFDEIRITSPKTEIWQNYLQVCGKLSNQ